MELGLRLRLTNDFLNIRHYIHCETSKFVMYFQIVYGREGGLGAIVGAFSVLSSFGSFFN